MIPATSLDAPKQSPGGRIGWSVEGRLVERQARNSSTQGEKHPRKVLAVNSGVPSPRWDGPTAPWIVLAFLFSPPHKAAMKEVKESFELFDIVSGDKWDLFVPGYFMLGPGVRKSQMMGDARKVFTDTSGNRWYWTSNGFLGMISQVECRCEGKWHYSGGTDLLLVNAFVPSEGEATVDWKSAVGGPVTDPETGALTMTLGQAVFTITRDLTEGLEGAHYGMDPVVAASGQLEGSTSSSSARDFLVQLAANIASGVITGLSGT